MFPISFILGLLSTTATITAQQITVNGGNVNLETCENVASQFNITLIYMGTDPVASRYLEAFAWAARRWSKVIVGDVRDVRSDFSPDDWFGGQFAPRTFAGPVDDVVIGYDIPRTIDGPSGTLGSAGAVFVRRDGNDAPTATISGVMIFDGADLDLMPWDDVTALITHEMGHVLGLVGTTTSRCTQGCDRENQQQSSYSCPLASTEYSTISIDSDILKLENSGGVGTACGHFEEDSFQTSTSSEVMTGFFEANLFQPLSSVTVAALEDLGYDVDYCGADIWPSTEETIKRFTVYKMSLSMALDEVTNLIPPEWVVDTDSGERTKWGEKSSAGAMPFSGRIMATALLVASLLFL